MTREEVTGTRDLTLSSWIRRNLPDSSTGYLVTDIDFLLHNFRTKKMMLLEIKTFHAPLKKWQENVFRALDFYIKTGVEAADNGWQYLGWHLIMFEEKDFSKKVFFDDKEITEEELKNILSF